MERLKGFLDADFFAYIPKSATEALNRSRANDWVISWRHRSGRGVLDRNAVGEACVGMQFDRCVEERSYQCRFLDLLEAHIQYALTVGSTFPIYEVIWTLSCLIIHSIV